MDDHQWSQGWEVAVTESEANYSCWAPTGKVSSRTVSENGRIWFIEQIVEEIEERLSEEKIAELLETIQALLPDTLTTKTDD